MTIHAIVTVGVLTTEFVPVAGAEWGIRAVIAVAATEF
jgi:hypothetical protein